jgi:drug/metabolite transporter (DMT)-like permease
LLIGTVPLFAAIFSAIIDRRAITWPTAAGLALGLLGLAVLLDPHGEQPSAWLAIGVSLAGSLSWSFGSVIAHRLPVPRRPLVSAAMQMLWVGAIFSIIAALAHEWPATIGVVTRPWAPSFVLTYGWLVFCAGLAGYIAYLWLLSNASLTLANSYAFVNPVVAVVLGIVFLAEPFTIRVVAGTAIVVAAVALIVLGRRERKGRTRAEADARI